MIYTGHPLQKTVQTHVWHPVLTASCPRGGRVSKSSREAWAAFTAFILEFIVPVRACWAEVCREGTMSRVLAEGNII